MYGHLFLNLMQIELETNEKINCNGRERKKIIIKMCAIRTMWNLFPFILFLWRFFNSKSLRQSKSPQFYGFDLILKIQIEKSWCLEEQRID